MEAAILLALQSVRVPGITELMALFSALGNMGFIWIIIGLICLFFAEKRPMGICIFLTIAVVYIVAELILDPVVARVRPCDASIGVNAVIGVSHSGYSFPSGHTTISFAVASVICMMSDSHKSKIAAVFLAIVIAFSRLYLGVHYPTDVLAGMVIGIVIAVIVVGLWRLFLGQLILGLFNLGAEKIAGSNPSRTSVSKNIHKRSVGGSQDVKGQGLQGQDARGRGASGRAVRGRAGKNYDAEQGFAQGLEQGLSQDASAYDRRKYSSRLSKKGAHSRKRSRK